jgi:hypothetical protein
MTHIRLWGQHHQNNLHVGHTAQMLKQLVNTLNLEATASVQISWNLVKKVVCMFSISSSNKVHLWLYSPNMGDPCLHCRGYCLCPNILEVSRKGCLDGFWKIEKIRIPKRQYLSMFIDGHVWIPVICKI